MPCFKYTISNACGHVTSSMYRYCGQEHIDDQIFNESCFTFTYGNHEVTPVRVGNTFCNRGCEAETVGWRCCTCGYKPVDGYYHTMVKMLVHNTESGDLHGFCDKCVTENDVRLTSTNENIDTNISPDPPAYGRRAMTIPANLNLRTHIVMDRQDDGTSSTTSGSTSSSAPADYEVSRSTVVDGLVDLMVIMAKSMNTCSDVMPKGPGQNTIVNINGDISAYTSSIEM
ncbi:hypothetical protein FALBO_13037 [Fusarium albosuccineum]|uniref:Uncharacterized protein n=1 Tax=Fusarium albosuccineum TaxID=1237068 RepID=A0A8H4L1B6_9HYPO|nr:hypothetical protein FALBO_13037 [Fusarium albosuccineum]